MMITNSLESIHGSPLLVCYMSGMDVRRLTPGTTPYLSSLLETYPHAHFVNLPSNELFPTLVTGVAPNVHGVWGVQYAKSSASTFTDRILDALPDIVTTGFQCFRHYLDNSYDLAAIPPHRRRHFKVTRTKYKRRNKRPEALFEIGGIPTVLGLAGSNRAHYSFSSSADPVKNVLPGLCENNSLIEILELYSLDRHQQWNLDRPSGTQRFYATIDDFIQKLHQKCTKKNISLMIVSDHGHEPIKESIDLCAKLKTMGLTNDDLSYFIEVSSARFWFHTDKARSRVTEWLSTLKSGTLLRYHEMTAYNVALADDNFGEFFFYLDPGYIFFPHDFHHPLARLFLGLSDPMQRSRLRNPRHRGNHGHLPYFAAEKSLILLADTDFEVESTSSDILSVAPSILSVLGIEPPSTMPGPSLFRRRIDNVTHK